MKSLRNIFYCLLMLPCGIAAKAQDSLYSVSYNISYYLNAAGSCNATGGIGYVPVHFDITIPSPGTDYSPQGLNVPAGQNSFTTSGAFYSIYEPSAVEFSIESKVGAYNEFTMFALNAMVNGSSSTYKAANSCFNGGTTINYNKIVNRISNQDGDVSMYCYDSKIRLALPGDASNVRWTVSNSLGNMKSISKSNTNTLEMTAADIKSLALDPRQILSFYAVADFGTIKNMKSNVLAGLVFVTQPPMPTVTATSPACAGDNGKLVLSDFKYSDGSSYLGDSLVNLTVKGTTNGIVQNLALRAISATFDVLPGDVYEIDIENSNSQCTQTIYKTINAAPAAVAVSTTVSCSGNAPAVTVAASGGTSPYKYGMVSPATGTANTFTGLTTGTAYTFYVADNNGCEKSAILTTNTVVLAILSAKSDPTGPGRADGNITVTAGGGGGAPYTYSKDNTTYQAGNAFSGLAQGNYTIWVKDKLGCTSSLSVTLTDPLPVVVSAVVTNISCNGLSDGSITASASGGIAPFTYSKDGNTYLTINSFSNLSVGGYTIWAKDSKGNIGSAGFTVTAPAALVISVSSQKDAVCKGIANGEIVVTAGGGTGAYRYQLNTGSYQLPSVFAVSAGLYMVTVADANSCRTSTPQVTINEPAQGVSFSSVTTAVACNGGNNGAVTVTPVTGVSPYKYSLDLSNWQTDGTLNNLTAGRYVVTVEDKNGCRASETGVTITQPAALQVSLVSVTDAACFGNSNGSIEVAASGGTGNVSYKISNAPAIINKTGKFTDLLAGNYIVTATDDNACQTTINVTVGQPDLLVLQPVITNVTCFGNANGKVVLSGVGGTGPYIYSADNISFGSGNTMNNLVAGNYTYYVKDNHSCTADIVVTVTQPAVLTFTPVVSDALCHGSSTGTITVTPAGGSNPFTYSADGNPFQTADVLTGIAAGTHSVSVMDAQGCIKTNNSIYVGEPTALTLQISDQQQVSCYGGSNGSFTLKAGGGTAAYQYMINSGTFQSSPGFNGLIAGDYTAIVKDVNGCTQSITVTVSQPVQLSLQTVSKTDILCAGTATGNMTLQASGGTGNYLYSLENGAYQSAGYYDHLSAKDYSITVKDDNQCTRYFTIPLVDLYQPLTAALSAVPPATCEDKGTIMVSGVQGGLSPYSYSLDNSNYVTDPLFSDLYNGDYTVYVKDNNGCMITRSISPYGPVSLHGSLQISPVSCNKGNNGIVTVQGVTGGNNNYEYSLDGVTYQSSSVFNNLTAGGYLVHVRDIPYSCQVVLSGMVTEPDTLQLSVVNNQAVSCYAGNDGAIQLQVNGGVGNNAFTINGSAANTNGFFNNLSADVYALQVMDGNGCQASLSVTVTQPAILTAAVAAITDISCYGSGDGQITLRSGGGTSPYVYSADGTIYQSSNNFNLLEKGNYTIHVKDNRGCQLAVTTAIAEPTSLLLDVTQVTDILCYGAATGDIEVTAAGGMGQYAFSLNGLPIQSLPVFNNLPAGDYLLAVADNNACVTRQSVTLSQPDRLQSDKQIKHPTCSYLQDGSMVMSVSGGVIPYSYSWSTGATDKQISGLAGGIYKVTVTDAHGCALKDSALLIQPDEIQINLGFRDTILCVGQTINLSAGNPGAIYSWTSDTGFSDDQQITAINKDGHYHLTVTAASGCVRADSFNVATSLTALTADFLLSSYASVGDTVIIIDVSRPKPATNQWTLPAGARDAGSAGEGTIRQLIFDQPGEYTIDMKVTLGECADAINKTIRIMPASQQNETDSLLGYHPQLIQELTAYPNPNDGQFKVQVKLSRSASIQLRVISFNTGNVEEIKTAVGSDIYEISFTDQQLAQGIYLIALQVGSEYKVIRILKM